MSNARVPPFTPSGNNVTVQIAVTSSSGGTAIPFDNRLPTAGGAFAKANTVRLYNAGPSDLYFELQGRDLPGLANIGTSVPLAAGYCETYTTGGATAISAVTASGATATLFATPGEGL